MKLSAAFEASIALSFGDVSDAYQSFPSTLGISDNPDYRANLQHCRITDIDYKRNHAGVSDHVRQTVRWWRRPSRALSTPHRPKAGKPMTQPAVDPLNRHRFILADIVSPNRQERVVRRIIICTVQLQGFSRSSNRFSVAASRPPHSQSTRQSDQKPARSTACSFFLKEMPELVQFHHALARIRLRARCVLCGMSADPIQDRRGRNAELLSDGIHRQAQSI